MIAAVFTTAVVTAVTITAAAALVSQVRAARAVIQRTMAEADMPVPYWPAAEDELLITLLCRPCRGGDGNCTCTIQCGQLPCMGGFSDEDVEFLQTLSMPEGGAQ